jgi:hypothetical protein
MECNASEFASTVEESTENPDSSWTLDEVKTIAGDCWKVDPGERWNSPDIMIRIELLQQLTIDPDDEQASEFAENAVSFQLMCECSTPKTDTITADALMPYINPLIALPAKDWTKHSVTQLVTFLSTVAVIDAQASDPTAMDSWLTFEPIWSSYVQAHPTICTYYG